MNKYWTKDKVFEESKKYKTRGEFAKSSGRAYQVAWKNKWLDDMDWLISSITIWNDDLVIEESKKYKTRGEFEKLSGSAYHYARIHNLLDDMLWLKKPLEFDEFVYCVYAYVDEENKVAYVGLTRDKNNRHIQHSHFDDKKCSPVYLYFTSICKDVPNPIYLDDNINSETAREREDYWRKWYFNNGYTMLNKGKTGKGCGSLGMLSRKWSKSKVFEESKKYSNRNDFMKGSSSAYTVAFKNKWLDEMDWLIPQCQYWSKEKVIDESKKYDSLNDFRTNSGSAYAYSCRMDILKDMVWLKRSHKFFTDDEVIEKSKEYTQRGDFKKYSKKEYNYAVRNHLLEKMTWLDSKIKYWTMDEVIEESKKYSTKMEFNKGNKSAYMFAWKHNMLNDLYPKQ